MQFRRFWDFRGVADFKSSLHPKNPKKLQKPHRNYFDCDSHDSANLRESKISVILSEAKNPKKSTKSRSTPSLRGESQIRRSNPRIQTINSILNITRIYQLTPSDLDSSLRSEWQNRKNSVILSAIARSIQTPRISKQNAVWFGFFATLNCVRSAQNDKRLNYYHCRIRTTESKQSKICESAPFFW